MANKIDARGLSCPQPVILAQTAVKQGSKNFEILVDSDVSKENIVRFLTNSGIKAEITNAGDGYLIRASG